MAKGGGRNSKAILNLSGILFLLAGSFHIARYFLKIEFRVGGFELTYLGSLVIGVLVLALSAACFFHAKD